MSDQRLWQADAVPAPEVPVARPHLPSADELLPYLREIDTTRWYSNSGPLQQRFQHALETRYGCGIACTANATLGLTLALMAQRVPRGSLCMMPAWTFAASAHAAVLAGLVPWLVDVDRDTEQLLPAAAERLLAHAPGRVGAVMPVMPFGRPMDSAAWDAFARTTGIAVVIDAAAAFDALQPSHVPAVVSLHATKALGIGEGGFVASSDKNLIDAVANGANFGFVDSREARASALNAKLSEYGAAVGLAALHAWPRTREAFARVATSYGEALAPSHSVTLPHGLGTRWISSTVTVALPAAAMDPALAALTRAGIGVRRWWGGGLHRHTAFEQLPRTVLPVTEELADTCIGLPCWKDLPDATIARIGDVLSAAVLDRKGKRRDAVARSRELGFRARP